MPIKTSGLRRFVTMCRVTQSGVTLFSMDASQGFEICNFCGCVNYYRTPAYDVFVTHYCGISIKAVPIPVITVVVLQKFSLLPWFSCRFPWYYYGNILAAALYFRTHVKICHASLSFPWLSSVCLMTPVILDTDFCLLHCTDGWW